MALAKQTRIESEKSQKNLSMLLEESREENDASMLNYMELVGEGVQEWERQWA